MTSAGFRAATRAWRRWCACRGVGDRRRAAARGCSCCRPVEVTTSSTATIAATTRRPAMTIRARRSPERSGAEAGEGPAAGRRRAGRARAGDAVGATRILTRAPGRRPADPTGPRAAGRWGRPRGAGYACRRHCRHWFRWRRWPYPRRCRPRLRRQWPAGRGPGGCGHTAATRGLGRARGVLGHGDSGSAAGRRGGHASRTRTNRDRALVAAGDDARGGTSAGAPTPAGAIGTAEIGSGEPEGNPQRGPGAAAAAAAGRGATPEPGWAAAAGRERWATRSSSWRTCSAASAKRSRSEAVSRACAK